MFHVSTCLLSKYVVVTSSPYDVVTTTYDDVVTTTSWRRRRDDVVRRRRDDDVRRRRHDVVRVTYVLAYLRRRRDNDVRRRRTYITGFSFTFLCKISVCFSCTLFLYGERVHIRCFTYLRRRDDVVTTMSSRCGDLWSWRPTTTSWRVHIRCITYLHCGSKKMRQIWRTVTTTKFSRF